MANETIMENIIQSADGTNVIIMNGGDPLPGCPTSSQEAWEWADRANKDNYKSWTDEEDSSEDIPKWSWDCGFKLDFDGPLFSINSRFYPPKTHYGTTWDGTVTVYSFGKTIMEKEFDCPTLEELRCAVTSFVHELNSSMTKAVMDFKYKPL